MNYNDDHMLDFIMHDRELDPSVVAGESKYLSSILILLTATQNYRNTARLYLQRVMASAFGPKLVG